MWDCRGRVFLTEQKASARALWWEGGLLAFMIDRMCGLLRKSGIRVHRDLRRPMSQPGGRTKGVSVLAVRRVSEMGGCCAVSMPAVPLPLDALCAQLGCLLPLSVLWEHLLSISPVPSRASYPEGSVPCCALACCRLFANTLRGPASWPCQHHREWLQTGRPPSLEVMARLH